MMNIVSRTGFLLALLAIGVGVPRSARAADHHAIDVHASQATFSVAHLFVQRVTGRLPIVAGDVDLAPDGTTPVSVRATLDPRRIDTGDSDRDGDLQGTDWFDTARYPLWTFSSSGVESSGPDAYAIAGMLTIHGTSVPVNLNATLVRGVGTLTYHAVAHVDRHAFDMVRTRVDGMIGSDVTIALEVRLR